MRLQYTWDVQMPYGESKRRQIMRLVCREFDVQPAAIKGPGKETKIVNARSVYCYLLRKHLGETLKMIGQDVKRDHTTALYCIRRVEKYMSMPLDAVARSLTKIEQQLK